jgi:O-antigen ligase
LAAITVACAYGLAYFTFSRGAWYALAVALLFQIAIDPRRLQFIAIVIVVAIWPVATIMEARRQTGLITVGTSLESATAGGHRLAPMLVVFALASAATSLCAAIINRRVRIAPPLRLAFAVAVAVVAAGAVAGVWIKKGSPATLASRGWSAFHRAPTGSPQDIESRLLSLSANGRLQLWHVSIRDFKASPLVGQGAGTFEETWTRYRSVSANSLQPHSLYLGTLGELGLVGLTLTGLFVLAPLVSSVRRRHVPLVPPIAAAYFAWALHTGVDWDWALVGVTAPALVCGVALVTQDGGGRAVTSRTRQTGAAVAIVLAAAATVVLIADKRIANALGDARIHPAAAVSAAQTATTLAPWSSEPYAAEAGAYQELRQKKLARRAALRAIEKDPTRWSLWHQLAEVTTGAERRRALARSRALNPFQTGR